MPVFTGDRGLFDADSLIWRLSRERVLLAGGMAAAILQIAHPAVAHGVNDHSDFRQYPLQRLHNTLDAVYTIAFGDRAAVETMRGNIARMHEAVKGTLPDRRNYSAFDPDAQLWVLATLIQTGICIYERWISPLTDAEKERNLHDHRIFGEIFGLDPAYGPQSWKDFCDYYEEMIRGSLLAYDPLCAEVAQAIAFPVRPLWLSAAARPLHFLVTELIPSPVRERLGFTSRTWTKTAMHSCDYLIPRLIPRLPSSVRFCRQYRVARKASASAIAEPAASPPV